MDWLFYDFMLRHPFLEGLIESYEKIDYITIKVFTTDGRIYFHVSTKPCPTTYKFKNEEAMHLWHYPEDESDWLLAFKRQLDWTVTHKYYGPSYAAELCGLSASSLSNYISRTTKRIPSVYLLMQIAIGIKCSNEDFINMFCYKPPKLDSGYLKPDHLPTELEWRNGFASRLDRLMYEHRITQQKLAKVMGVSQGTISNYLNSRSSPNAQTIYRIARYLDLSTQELSDLLGYV